MIMFFFYPLIRVNSVNICRDDFDVELYSLISEQNNIYIKTFVITFIKEIFYVQYFQQQKKITHQKAVNAISTISRLDNFCCRNVFQGL